MELNALSRVPAFSYPSIIVDFNNASHVHLLEKAWDKLFLKEFPEPKQCETVQDWIRRSTDPNVIVTIPVIGENLHDPERASIKGFAVSTLYKKSGALMLDFNIVDEVVRGQGIGEQLILERKFNAATCFGKPLNGLYAETQHAKRFTGRGDAHIVPINYTMPSLTGGAKDEDLFLISYALPDGRFASAETTDQMLLDQFEHYGVPGDMDLVRMRRELRVACPALGAV